MRLTIPVNAINARADKNNFGKFLVYFGVDTNSMLARRVSNNAFKAVPSVEDSVCSAS